MLMDEFRIEIRRLEGTEVNGLWAPQILEHTNPKLDFAGANYAGFDEIINGYTFEITGVAERVDLEGSNNNLIDVFIASGVSLVPGNSAGLQIVAVGSGLTTAEHDQLMVLDTENVDVAKVNNITVGGVGSSGDPWGPV